MSLDTLDIIPASSFETLGTHWWEPDPRLLRWIQCLWAIPAQSADRPAIADKLYPDAGTSLIIQLNGQQSRCYFFYNTETQQHVWDPRYDHLSVRFRPGAVSKLFNPELLELTNIMVPVSDADLPGISNLIEIMSDQPRLKQNRSLQTWLLSFIHAQPTEDSNITKLVSALRHTVINPYEFAADQGISRRTLERRLRGEIGVTAKQLHDFNRIRKARQLLMSPMLPLTDIALQSGYYDQAHFTNAFRASTEETPVQYRQRKLSHFSKA